MLWLSYKSRSVSVFFDTQAVLPENNGLSDLSEFVKNIQLNLWQESLFVKIYLEFTETHF